MDTKQLVSIQNRLNNLDDEIFNHVYLATSVQTNAKRISAEFYQKIKNKPTEVLERYSRTLMARDNNDILDYFTDTERLGRIHAVTKTLLEREYASIDAKMN
jgi:hypothetical protein